MPPGADGGSVPRRDEVVKNKERAPQRDSEQIERAKWQLCALSKEPLQEPIVSDFLGHLINKEALIQAILSHSLPAVFSHIRSMKDVVEARFTRNPERNHQQVYSSFICPITMIEAGGAHGKFVLLAPCGCCLSQKALNEVQTKSTTTETQDHNKCLVCGKKIDKIIILNGSEEEIAHAMAVLEAEKQSRELKRKNSSTTTTTTTTPETTKEQPGKKKQKTTSTTNDPNPKAGQTIESEKLPEGATKEVYHSIFHSQNTAQHKNAPSSKPEDLFARSGFGGNK